MLQFKALSSDSPGASWVASHFPFTIGRAGSSHLRLEQAGVWDRHAIVELDAEEGFVLVGQAGALLRVNGESVERARLHNGDVIECGGARLQCWLAEVQRKDQRVREALLWIGLVLLTIAQVVIILKLR